ncbi:MAG: hypothetical protein KDF60_13380 [Calditrichaeota bacterium]|nr:hypothetical protein [Calditrichota bacterium]
MLKKLITVISLTTLYSIIRYLINGPVSINNLPVFILNKSVAMASVLFLTFSIFNYLKNDDRKKQFWGTVMFHSVCIHILLSSLILSKAYYPKFFGPEKMNLTGELVLLFGVLAAYFFTIAKQKQSQLVTKRRLQIFALLFLSAHLVSMDISGWIHVSKWNGGFPPISLISFIFSLSSIFLLLIPHKIMRIPPRLKSGSV